MSEKILFVDDEFAILQSYKRLLHQEFRIDTAGSGTEALALLANQGPYAVVVVDMRMPEMDGAQLLSKITVRFPDVLRIMLTGNQDMETAKRAVNEGNVFRLLTKPCTKESLSAALNAALVHYRLKVFKQAGQSPADSDASHAQPDNAGLMEAMARGREILKTNASVRLPSTKGGVYVGKAIWEGPNHLLQAISSTVAVAHPKSLLDIVPKVGDIVKIEYSHGTATVEETHH